MSDYFLPSSALALVAMLALTTSPLVMSVASMVSLVVDWAVPAVVASSSQYDYHVLEQRFVLTSGSTVVPISSPLVRW